MSLFLHDTLRTADILDCVIVLQTFSGDINTFDDHERTPLMILVQRKCKTLDIARKIVTLCLILGVDLNLYKRDGRTALYYAIEAHMRFFVVALLENKARLDITVDSSYSILHKAVLCQNPDIIAAVFEYAPLSVVRMRDLYNGNTFLHDLINQDAERLIHYLMRNDKILHVVYVCNDRGHTPLMHAALKRRPCTSVIASLLSRCDALTRTHTFKFQTADEVNEEVLLAKRVIAREITKNCQL